MNKKWEYYQPNEFKVAEISKKNNISELLATVLVNRGIIEDNEIQVFLNPTRNDFYDPYLLPDMQIAVERIILAINNNEKVIIYGDYDVDGITSVTVLKKFLEERGIYVDYYIPNRLDEGYGLNKNAIDKIAQLGYSLMITVDCGISAHDEIDYAKELNIDVIVTDHHETLEKLPNAIAVVDAKREDSKYPFRELAGVGVVFKLIQAIAIKMKLEEKEYLKYLDIVCIGTISDIVPLVSENRVIAKLGLKLVEQTKNEGLKALLKVIKYNHIDSNAISFGIAPRINACGRMGHEAEGLKLFLTDNIVEAESITTRLNQYNIKRQETEKAILKEAIQKIEEENMMEKNCIVLGGENWHHGVIGIVASKITEIYYKPTILLCFEGEEAKGSGRSIQGFDLHEALCATSKYLEKYGGHEMAVGLSLKKQNFLNFKQSFDKIADNSNIKQAQQIIEIDKKINIKEINKEMIKELKYLEPYGENNKVPIFNCKNLKIGSIRALADGKHLKLTLIDENIIIDAIGFNMGSLVNEYLIGDKVDVIGFLEVNSFNGIENIQINLKDIMRTVEI